jgi:hypothetical protein
MYLKQGGFGDMDWNRVAYDMESSGLL